MFRLFNNLSVSKKINFGLGSILLLLLLVSALSLFEFRNASAGFTSYREMARDSNLAARLQANMLMARMAVKNFILNQDEAALEDYNHYFNRMSGFLEDAQQEIQKPHRAAKVDSISMDIDIYNEAFDEVKTLKSRRNALVLNVLNVEGPIIAQNLTDIMFSAEKDRDMKAAFHSGLAMKHLLLARLHVTKFLDTNDQPSVDRVVEEFAKMQDQLATLDRDLRNRSRRTKLAAVQEGKVVYENAFTELVTVILTRNDLIHNTLDRIGPEIAILSEDVKLSIKADQDAIGPQLVASNRRSIILLGIISAFALVVGFLISRVLASQLLKPILSVATSAQALAAGNLHERVSFTSHDELGQLGTAFNEMGEKILVAMQDAQTQQSHAEKAQEKAESAMAEAQSKQAYLADSVDQMLATMDQFAEGNLTVSLEPKHDDEIGKLFAGFNRAVANLKAMFTQVNRAVTATSNTSTQILAAAEQIAGATQEQAVQAEEVFTTVDAMVHSIIENSATASQTAQVTSANRQFANKGAKVVEKTIEKIGQIADVVTNSAETVKGLSKSSEEIGNIVSVINEIAGQTSLLALNAAIEAARAGEHGRGFAVVADEVRQLAQRTTNATREIADMITRAQEDAQHAVVAMEQGLKEVKDGMQLADQTGTVLKNIVNGIDDTTERVTTIAAANEEQSATSEQISHSVEAISTVSKESAKDVADVARAAEALLVLTQELQSLVVKFNVGTTEPLSSHYETSTNVGGDGYSIHSYQSFAVGA